MVAETQPSAPAPGETSRGISEQDRQAVASVDFYLTQGVALKVWWDQASGGGGAGQGAGPGRAAFTQQFGLARTFNPADESFGFFGEAPVGDKSLPVMGNYQKMHYDRPKTPRDSRQQGIDWMRDQMREFVLHYFMRVSSFQLPEADAGQSRPEVPALLKPLSWCPTPHPVTEGFGFRQLFYKRRDSGEIGEFPEAERFAIVDLREIGSKYAWILLKVDLFDFSFSWSPLGPGGPSLNLPLTESSYLVLSPDFVANREEPSAGVLGRYGFGYAFIKNPAPGLIAFGPGEFDAAFETIAFEVAGDGSASVDMVFVVNRPKKLLNVSFDPLAWGVRLADLVSFGMTSRLLAPARGAFNLLPPRSGIDPIFAYVGFANLLSAGRAADELCISHEQLEREFLVKHFMQHYTMASGSLMTWREVADWLDPETVPPWAKAGRRSP